MKSGPRIKLLICAITVSVFTTSSARAQYDQQATALVQKAYDLISAQRFGEAVPLLQRSIQLEPNNWTAEYNLGFAFDQLNRKAEAFTHFRKALAIDPEKEDAWMRVADAYAESKDYTHAIPLYEQYLQKFPQSDKRNEAYIQLGVALAQSGRLKNSWDQFNRGLALKPNDPWGWKTAAWAYDVTNNVEQAIYMYKECLKRFPSDPEAKENAEQLKLLEYKRERKVVTAQAENASKMADDMKGFITVQQPVSEKSIALVKRGLRTVPREYRQELVEAGYKVLVCPTIVSAFPEMGMEHPRGWEAKATWHNNNGVFKSNIKTTVVGERKLSIIDGTYITDDEIDKTAAHELGHAYDHFLGGYAQEQNFADSYAWFSHGKEFTTAYNQDAPRVPALQRKRLDYFLQPGDAGKEELFAQMFPLLYCGRPAPGSSEELFASAFPHVLSVMSQTLSPIRLKNRDLYDSRVRNYAGSNKAPATTRPARKPTR